MGMDFSFSTAPTIIFGKGALGRIGAIAAERLGVRPLLVTDKGLAGSRIIADALETLRRDGHQVTIFDQVVADPPSAVVEAAGAAAKAHGCDCVIGIGGGSSLDVAKLAALIGAGDIRLEDAYGVEKVKGRRLPLLLAPTTAGTGSEVTPVAIVTTGAHEKMGVSSRVILPDVALLDPMATLALPAHVTAATGIDAMVHAIEAYTSINPSNNPMSRMLAEKALRLLAANLERSVNDGQDVEARADMLLGAMLAGQAFANSPVGAVHALAYPVGSNFGIAHGVSNAVVLLPVMRFNAAVCAADYADLGPHAFPELVGLPLQQRAEGFMDGLRRLMVATQVPTGLSAIGIREADLGALAEAAMRQTRLLGNNPRPVDYDSALAIYREAWAA